jgi:hypothetical protein
MPVALAAAVACAVSGLRSSADDKPAPAPQQASGGKESPQLDMELRTFMRIKLQLSNQILEGLCTEDLDLVKNGAKALGEMSTAERWRVTTDPLYRQFSGDFREITQQLIKAAEEGNMDRATLKWMDATMSCMDCHRFVRGMRIAN